MFAPGLLGDATSFGAKHKEKTIPLLRSKTTKFQQESDQRSHLQKQSFLGGSGKPGAKEIWGGVNPNQVAWETWSAFSAHEAPRQETHRLAHAERTGVLAKGL